MFDRVLCFRDFHNDHCSLSRLRIDPEQAIKELGSFPNTMKAKPAISAHAIQVESAPVILDNEANLSIPPFEQDICTTRVSVPNDIR